MSKRKRVLTWKPNWRKRGGGGRWCKMIDGQMVYFGTGKSESDTRSYRSAGRRYFEFLGEREVTRPIEILVNQATIADICEKFLQQLHGRYQRGEITATHVEHTRCCLTDFAAAVGPGKQFGCIGEMDIEDYRSRTLGLPLSEHTGRPIRPATARGRLKAVRAMFRWAWKMHLIENLPRNIDDIAKMPNGNGNGCQPEVRTFTKEELKALWANAVSRTRCLIALAINCGMGQQDISDLRTSEICWDGGYIERARSKTGVLAKHKLWSVTLHLMEEHRDRDAEGDDRLFLGKNGLPLVRRWLENSSLKHSDAVKNAFDRLLKKTGLQGSGRGFYCLRKSGASIVERIDPTVTEMYLSHAEPGMKRAYAERDWARLARALGKMERHLGGVLR